jgi:tungstate transport system ATP-binding protein
MLFNISDLTKKYSDRTILDIPALSFKKGAIYGLQGPNGAGKTTLLNILALLEIPTSGIVSYKSEPVQYSEPYLQPLRKEVVLVDQLPLLFTTTVFNNMEFGLKIRRIEKEERKRRILKGLEMVGMEDFAQLPAHQLSGGETQRVALASRLVLKPEVLLLDEPTANVDAASARQIKDASLMARREWGTTLIIASHDRDWLYEVCDEVMHLFRGRLIGAGEENVIFGPWHSHKDSLWERKLPDGQRIYLPGAPGPDAVALIEPTSITPLTETKRDASGANILEGIVSRLTLEKMSAEIVATILIGNLPFTVKLSTQKIRQENLYPGQRVTLHYSHNSVKWL